MGAARKYTASLKWPTCSASGLQLLSACLRAVLNIILDDDNVRLWLRDDVILVNFWRDDEDARSLLYDSTPYFLARGVRLYVIITYHRRRIENMLTYYQARNHNVATSSIILKKHAIVTATAAEQQSWASSRSFPPVGCLQVLETVASAASL
jgi:hypothetical protein